CGYEFGFCDRPFGLVYQGGGEYFLTDKRSEVSSVSIIPRISAPLSKPVMLVGAGRQPVGTDKANLRSRKP
ncbi:MAG: hypothetical protein ACPGVU_20870, partial [Limisphaerales bacterium]